MNQVSDFRSDTVTRPTPSMYEAMATAPLGDDVFGDDPTVIKLQEEASALFGKEAGLFVPSGTMGNQIAVRVHTNLGDELIVEESCHTFLYEQGGVAQISGVQARTLKGVRGQMDLEEVRSSIRMDNEHFPVTSLIIVENTHNGSGGSVLPEGYVAAVRGIADENRMSVHLDGARIFNAVAQSGHSPAELAADAHSVTFCLSKALSAPIGSVLLGTHEFIRQARRVRKVLGGGMRQVGILAAAGLVALQEMPQKLSADHERAAALYRGFTALGQVTCEAPETNMIYVELEGFSAPDVAESLKEQGVLVAATGPQTLRFVTHKDIDDTDVARAIAALADVVVEG